MTSGVTIRRRDTLKAAAIGLLAGATSEAQAADPGNRMGPALAEFKGKLYAIWRGAGTDDQLWYASFDGSKWAAPARIGGVGTSAAPSLAVFRDKLYAAWKGRRTEQTLWFASFDGLKWSGRARIPGGSSSAGPWLSVFRDKLYAAWKGMNTDQILWYASFDGSKWQMAPSGQAKVAGVAASPPNVHPFSPEIIANSGLSGAGGINQGKYGDCVFEAAMAAVATTVRGRAAISQMIVQTSDGSYTVTFPGAAQSPVKVMQSALEATGVSDSATWADVLEAALIISNRGFANGGGNIPAGVKAATNPGQPTPAQYALYLLTGGLASKDLASSSKIGDKIAVAMAKDQPVVAHCGNNDKGALVSGHEWTVTACDPRASRITLRNPWGSFGTAGTTKAGIAYKGDAQVDMTLQLFGRFYDEVTFGYQRA
jgi:hypothetical protein